jgi:hypothetical protein
MKGHYYLHPEPSGGHGKALESLLARYNPATEVDRDLLRAFFLSLFWGGEPGHRPCFLVTAPDDDRQAGRGVGKSTIAKHGARCTGAADGVRPREASRVGRFRTLRSPHVPQFLFKSPAPRNRQNR